MQQLVEPPIGHTISLSAYNNVTPTPGVVFLAFPPPPSVGVGGSCMVAVVSEVIDCLVAAFRMCIPAGGDLDVKCIYAILSQWMVSGTM